MKLNLKLTSLLLGICVLAGPTASAMDPRHDYCAKSALVTHSDDSDDSYDGDDSDDSYDGDDSDDSYDGDDSDDSGVIRIDDSGVIRIEESFRALPDLARSTLPCRDRDRYPNIGTVIQAPRKPERQQILNGEYRLKSGKEVNATKLFKTFCVGTRGKVSAIATQCPHNPTALSNFFELILTSKINCLVVIGEPDTDKLPDYWNPNAVARELRVDERTIASGIKYYNIVSSRINRQEPGYTVYDLEIGEFLGGVRTDAPSKTIHLYHYQQWPDHGVPTDIDNFYNFVDHIASLSNVDSNLKVLVHCSAGIGRTGTFLACLISAIKQPTIIIPPQAVKYAQDVVKYLREHRSGMVQNLEQYEILYNFIIYQQVQRRLY